MPKRKNFDSILTSGQTYKKQFTEEEKEAWVEIQKQNRETANGIVETHCRKYPKIPKSFCSILIRRRISLATLSEMRSL